MGGFYTGPNMISHAFISITDFTRALAFYEPLMRTLGAEPRFSDATKPWAGWQPAGGGRPLLVIGHPYDGQPHSVGNGAMLALAAATRVQVDAAHAAALAHGGSDEGAPGLRPHYHANYYGAYFRDPDGNKLAVACHGPDPAELPDWTDDLSTVDWHELEALYRAAPLGNKSAQQLKTVFHNSRHRAFVREGGKLVGAGRVVADGADAAYLCDIALLPGHQGRGLGRQIVLKLLEPVRGYKKVILYSVPGKEDFYRKLGFARMATAMAIFENPEAAFQRGHLAERPAPDRA